MSTSSSYQCGELTKNRHLRHLKNNKNNKSTFLDHHHKQKTSSTSGMKKSDWLESLENTYMQLSLRSIAADYQCTFNDFKQVNGINSPLPENVFKNFQDPNHN